MKNHLWDLFYYIAMLGVVYFSTQYFMLAVFGAIFLIGAVEVFVTLLSIVCYALIWFWDATVNYRKENTEDEK
jgi:threonine/homoserine/homoserine lactone efflux protein